MEKLPKKSCRFSNKMSATQHSLGWPPSEFMEGSKKSKLQPKGTMCVGKQTGEDVNLVGIITGDQTQLLSNDATQANAKHSKNLNAFTVSLNTEAGDSSEGNRCLSYRKEATIGDILQNRAGCPPNLLKKRLFDELNWERKCSSCRLTKWLGDPIALKLNHIDGNTDNNLLTNLRLLCANCYCQVLLHEDDDNSVDLVPKTKKQKCKDCKLEISDGAIRCVDCNGKNNRKTKRPSKDELVKDRQELRFFTKIGEKYGVSDNAVRKWFKKYEIDLK